MRVTAGLLLALLAGSCSPLTARIGPFAINEVAPLQQDAEGRPGDWLEICNRGDTDRPLKDWQLRAEWDGREALVHAFDEDAVLFPNRRNLVGPGSVVPDVRVSLDLPASTGPVRLKLFDHEGTLVDSFVYSTGGARSGVVSQRRCDCRRDGQDGADTLLLPREQATPGQPSAEDCIASPSPFDAGAVPMPDAGNGTSASSSSGGDACSVTGGCHALYPVDGAGRTWTFGLMGSSGAGSQVVTTQGAAASGGFAVHVETTVDGASSTADYTYTCTANVLSQPRLATSSTSNGAPVTTTTTFDPPLDILRATFTTGSSFTQSSTGALVATTPIGPVNQSLAVQQTVTVEAQESVQTPAGTFQALRVKQSGTINGSAVETTTWYVPGKGVVKSIGPPPVFSPGSTPPVYTWALQSCAF